MNQLLPDCLKPAVPFRPAGQLPQLVRGTNRLKKTGIQINHKNSEIHLPKRFDHFLIADMNLLAQKPFAVNIIHILDIKPDSLMILHVIRIRYNLHNIPAKNTIHTSSVSA